MKIILTTIIVLAFLGMLVKEPIAAILFLLLAFFLILMSELNRTPEGYMELTKKIVLAIFIIGFLISAIMYGGAILTGIYIIIKDLIMMLQKIIG